MQTTKPTESTTSAQKYIVLRNKQITDFYEQNKHLDPIAMNLLFIDVMKNLSTNLSTTLNTTVNNKILEIVSELSQTLGRLNSDILLRLHDSKKDYVEEVKMIVTNLNAVSAEKLQQSIDKSSDNLITKTSLIFNEFIPKTNEKSTNEINMMIQTICNNISDETSKIIEVCKKDETNTANLGDIIEQKIANMFGLLQQPLLNLLTTSQDHNRKQVEDLKMEITNAQSAKDTIFADLKTFLDRYQIASVKGEFAENQLFATLQKLLPTDEVIDVSGKTSSGDIIVHRHDKSKPSILFESKDYAKTVHTAEVTKFE
jgi:hypothetical protein